MNRAKLFIENFFAYGFIQVLNKIIPFLLLPVITRLLKDPSDFGVYDMYNLIIGFGSPLVMLGMYDAMFREYFEKDDQEYQHNVTTTAQRIVLITSIVVSLILFVFSKTFSKIFFGTINYSNIVSFSSIALLISANSTIIAAPTRIQNKRKIYIVSGLLNSSAYYLLAILLIYLGYSYFGMIYANIITSIILTVFFWILNKEFFMKGKYDKNIAKELLKIGIPLLPTFLIYWVYNSMDRIMISNMLGAGELGIYSIGSKLAQISQFIYAAFAGGWQHFAFSTMKDEDQVQLNSRVAEYLGAISFAVFFMFCPFIKIIFKLLFTKDYFQGYRVVPYLFLSPLLLMIFQVIGNQFLVVKKSYWSTISLGLGAAINVLLNAILIPNMGIEGAAIATLTGYVITLIIVCIVAKKMKLLILSNRFITANVLTIFYLLINRFYLFDKFKYQLLFSLILIFVFVVLYKNELNMVLRKFNDMRGLKND